MLPRGLSHSHPSSPTMTSCVFRTATRAATFLAGLFATTSGIAQTVPFIPNDPYFGPNLPLGYSGQWYLRNQAPAEMTISYSIGGQIVSFKATNAGLDANLWPAWQRGLTGSGVVIGIVGITGVQGDHPDLAAGYRADLSRQFSQDPAIASQPQGPLSELDNHDTAVAGVAAARGGNGTGMTGAAPLAGLAVFRVDNPDNTINPAANQNYVDANYFASGVDANRRITGYAAVAVRNRSYARTAPFAVEDTRVIQSLQDTAANNVIHVFAAGNFRGTPSGDTGRLERNQLASAIAVAALGSDGKFAEYSNYGASLFVTAPGARLDGTGLLAPTVDRTADAGFNPGAIVGDLFPDRNYTGIFNGTSATAPVVSGIVALGKQLNPFLDVRGARHAFAVTSRVVDPNDASPTGGWQTNGAGLRFNPNYGFGLVDAGAFTSKVEEMAYVTAPQSYTTGTRTPLAANATLGATPRTETFKVDAAGFASAGVSAFPLEAVEIALDVSSLDRAALEGTLTSPAGTTSRFMNSTHQLSGYGAVFADPTPAAGLRWTFVANNFWGENPFGDWQLSLADLAGNNSTWNSYAVTFHLGRMVLESGSLNVTTPTTAHAVVLDQASTAMTIAADTTFSVRDEFWVNDGTLRVDGRLQNHAASGLARSHLRLNGGRLTGNGTIATSLGVLNTAGTVRPGDGGTVGTLSVEGGYTQESNGVLEIDIASNTRVDQLVVRNGQAVLGGTLRVNVLPGADIVAGPIAPLVRVEAGGVVSGAFERIEGLRVRPTLALRRAPGTGNVFALEAYRDYLVSDVSTHFTTTDRELATYLNSAATRTGGPYEDMLRAIDRQTTTANAAAAIRAVAPFSPAVVPTVMLAGDSSRLDTLLRHTRAGADPGLFVEFSHLDADIDPTVRRPGFEHQDRGILAGYGFSFGPTASAGVFVAAADSRARVGRTPHELDGDHRAGGVHATWSTGPFRLSAAAQYGWADLALRRSLNFPGTSETVRSTTDGHGWSAVVEAARPFATGPVRHQVFANVRTQEATIDGYTEPGAFGWSVAEQRERTTTAQLGYEIAHPIDLDGRTLQPFATLLFAHDFESSDHAVAARLPGDTAAPLQLHTERADRDYAQLQAGAALLLPRSLQVYALATVDLGRSDGSRTGIHLGLRHRF